MLSSDCEPAVFSLSFMLLSSSYRFYFAEKYLASLAHTRAGIPEAIVSSGAVLKLLFRLRSENDLVRTAAAQALGNCNALFIRLLLLLMICRVRFFFFWPKALATTVAVEEACCFLKPAREQK